MKTVSAQDSGTTVIAPKVLQMSEFVLGSVAAVIPRHIERRIPEPVKVTACHVNDRKGRTPTAANEAEGAITLYIQKNSE